MVPEMLRTTNWLNVVGGVVVAPAAPTCNGSTYDFFVVAAGLECAVAGVQRLDDAGHEPHWPARLLLRGGARRHMVRRLVRPRFVPGCLPVGPLPEPPVVDASEDVSQLAGDIGAATAAWYIMARAEWSSLLGERAEQSPHDSGGSLQWVLWQLGMRAAPSTPPRGGSWPNGLTRSRGSSRTGRRAAWRCWPGTCARRHASWSGTHPTLDRSGVPGGLPWLSDSSQATCWQYAASRRLRVEPHAGWRRRHAPEAWLSGGSGSQAPRTRRSRALRAHLGAHTDGCAG